MSFTLTLSFGIINYEPMLRLFRKIRYRIFGEVSGTEKQSNTGKYLKYAAGEIVLVVIGILIALQVNNWNEDRKDRALEKEILIQLESEYQNNLKDLLAKNVLRKENIMSSALWLLSAIDKNTLDANLDSLNYHLGKTIIVPSFDPVNGISQELISTGKLQLIQNDSLKVQLTQWPSIVEDFLLREEKIYASFIYDQYIPFLIDNYQIREIILKIQNDSVVNEILHSNNSEFFIGRSESYKAAKKLKENEDFEDYLSLIMGWSNYLNKGTSHVINVSYQTLELIEQ